MTLAEIRVHSCPFVVFQRPGAGRSSRKPGPQVLTFPPLPPWHRSGRAYFSAMLARLRAALLIALLFFLGVRPLPAQSGSEGPRVLVPTSRDANTAVLEAIQGMPRY